MVCSSCVPCPVCTTLRLLSEDPHVPPPSSDPTCEPPADAERIMKDSFCRCTGWFGDFKNKQTNKQTNSLLIWNAWIMDRIWICCKILLFLSVSVNSSLHDGDASCDGAFDIYFVLDRWVSADCFRPQSTCLLEGMKEPAAGTGQYIHLMFVSSVQRQPWLSPLHVWLCLVLHVPLLLHCRFDRVYFHLFCCWSVFGVYTWIRLTVTASRAPLTVLCCCWMNKLSPQQTFQHQQKKCCLLYATTE